MYQFVVSLTLLLYTTFAHAADREVIALSHSLRMMGMLLEVNYYCKEADIFYRESLRVYPRNADTHELLREQSLRNKNSSLRLTERSVIEERVDLIYSAIRCDGNNTEALNLLYYVKNNGWAKIKKSTNEKIQQRSNGN